MKRLLTLTISAMLCTAVWAQEAPSYLHSINVGVGLWASFGAEDPGFSDNTLYEERGHRSPISSVTYQYMMDKHWSVGATASMLYYQRKMKYVSDGSTADKKSDTLLSLMFTTRYYWRTKNWVRIYSSASLGLGYEWEKKYKKWSDSEKMVLCGQISPIGIEIGKHRLIGFGELGLGMTGWVRGGIGYRF